jgi:Cu(I)/Ag(I) efflux system membrane fusion protein
MQDSSVSPTGARLFFRALLVRARFVLLLGAVVAIAVLWNPVRDRIARASRSSDPSPQAAQFYCPMHPAVLRAAEDTCPSCGMALSRREGGEPAAAGEPTRVTLAPWRIAQAGIRTEEVSWRPLSAEIVATGTLRFDEAHVRRIGAGFVGRVTSVERSFDGATVRKGEPLLRLVGPDLQATLQSYAATSKQLREAEGRSATAAIERLRTQADQLRRQLLQWGFDAEQLAADADTATGGDDVALRAPFDCVVLHLEVAAGQQVAPGTPLVHVADPAAIAAELAIRRADAGLVAAGRVVHIQDALDPSLAARGRVAHVSGFVAEETQALLVRVAIEERDPRLRPGAAVVARIEVPLVEVEPWRSLPRPAAGGPRTVFVCPMHDLVREEPGTCERCGGMKLLPREVAAGPGPGDVLAVPAAAVVETGAGGLVYVETEPGVFAARAVELGPETRGYRPVTAGLAAGERVAAAGSFLVDAEARLDPSIAATYFGAATKTPERAGGAPSEAKPPR